MCIAICSDVIYVSHYHAGTKIFLSVLYQRLGGFEEAEQLLQEAIKGHSHLYGEIHPITLVR